MTIRTRIRALIIAVVVAACALTGCSAADTASRNLSQASDNFEVNRRITFVNGITDKYLLTIEGLCSINDSDDDNSKDQLEVTCKVGENAFKKHFLGLSDNVTYVVEQLDAATVDAYHYRIIYRPETIVPDVDLQTSGQDG